MPLVNSDFNPSWPLKYTQFQTVLPTLLRKINNIHYIRQRINTKDDDFVDLDWSYAKTSRIPGDSAGQSSASLAVLCHGLEGSSERAYILGMVNAFNQKGIDAVAYNYRSCSGEMNLYKKFYTAGSTDDLQDVLDEIHKLGRYQSIYLVGFSLGANLVLKYGGEKGPDIHPDIKGIVAISAPCDLRSSSLEMHKTKNVLFSIRFLRMLSAKVRAKAKQYPELNDINLKAIRTLRDFDNQITAPLAGYQDAEDYWRQASCSRVLSQISIPALILNAADDPILGPECYPYQEAQDNPYIYLEVPARGGHVGFMNRPNQSEYWHESRTLEFLLKTK